MQLPEDKKKVDLEEWEDLFRNQFFHKVTGEIGTRVEQLQNSVLNRGKLPMGLDDSLKTAQDTRAISELNKLLFYFESLKQQIMQQKGVK